MDKNNVQFSKLLKKPLKKTQKLTSEHNALIFIFRQKSLLAYFFVFLELLVVIDLGTFLCFLFRKQMETFSVPKSSEKYYCNLCDYST